MNPDYFSPTDAEPTTAEGLGRLYKELLEEGVPHELAEDIVRDAARALTGDGIIRVKKRKTCCCA